MEAELRLAREEEQWRQRVERELQINHQLYRAREQTSHRQFNSKGLFSYRPPTYLRLVGLFFLLGLNALLA